MTREEVFHEVRTHIVPLIVEAHRVCMEAYEADEFNTTYTFGCQFYGNTWSRIRKLVLEGNTPFRLGDVGEEGNVLICGGFYIRHHRADVKTRLPRCAKRARAEAVQLCLFDDDVMPDVGSGSTRLLLASITTPGSGSDLDILLGTLAQSSNGEIGWIDAETVSLLAPVDSLVPVENVSSPSLTLRGRPDEEVVEPTVSLRPRRSQAVG